MRSMEFCSKYGYNYGFDGSEEEVVSDEDEFTHERVRRTLRKADTNIIALKLDSLIEPFKEFNGQVISCDKCHAILSPSSENRIRESTWVCEFCDEENDVSSQYQNINEYFHDNDVTYMDQSSICSPHQHDHSLITFCIDISGSMKGSRIKAIQNSCIQTINHLKNDQPNAKVSLITFSNRAKYYGDTSKCQNDLKKPLLTINPTKDASKFDDQIKKILKCGQAFGQENLLPIEKSFEGLKTQMLNLKADGQTSLGPALLFATALNSSKAGSSIILSTDGYANIGLGSIDETAEKFYDNLAEYASKKDITVNVISFEGSDCKLALLGRVAYKTNGTLKIVNPISLEEEFKSIVDNHVSATNVEIKLIVNHKYIYIRNEEIEEGEAKGLDVESLKKSTEWRRIGNVNDSTEITFEYGFRRIEKSKLCAEAQKEFPFQLQISYVDKKGKRGLRVITRMQEFTRDRVEAEKNILSEELLCVHAAQKMSSHVLKSNVSLAKMRKLTQESLFARNSLNKTEEYKKTTSIIQKLSNQTQASQMSDQLSANMFMSARISSNKSSCTSHSFERCQTDSVSDSLKTFVYGTSWESNKRFTSNKPTCWGCYAKKCICCATIKHENASKITFSNVQVETPKQSMEIKFQKNQLLNRFTQKSTSNSSNADLGVSFSLDETTTSTHGSTSSESCFTKKSFKFNVVNKELNVRNHESQDADDESNGSCSDDGESNEANEKL